jgi:translation initiation factor IF-2
VGAVTEGDVLLADASDALIIGFHVDVEPARPRPRRTAASRSRLHRHLPGDRGDEGGPRRPPRAGAGGEEHRHGDREGGLPDLARRRDRRLHHDEGKIERTNQCRLIRDGKVVHTGKIESLKRFKDDVKEVVEGYECGIKIANHDDVRKNDVIQGFMVEKVARKLEKKAK